MATTIRSRREPPAFRRVEVDRVEPRTAHLVRVTLAGPDLAGFEPGLPAASVRLLVPPADGSELELPTWNGNEFLFADGRRPPIRTLTPLRFDPARPSLDVEIVRHGEGPLSSWAERVATGDRTALSGPGRGYEIDPEARAFLLAGDESALPAIAQLLPLLPRDAAVHVIVEIRGPTARLDLPAHPGLEVQWCERAPGGAPGEALVPAVSAAAIDPDGRVWVAGEAAAVQRIRKHLFERRGLARSHAVVRGYWKRDRSGGGDD